MDGARIALASVTFKLGRRTFNVVGRNSRAFSLDLIKWRPFRCNTSWKMMNEWGLPGIIIAGSQTPLGRCHQAGVGLAADKPSCHMKICIESGSLAARLLCQLNRRPGASPDQAPVPLSIFRSNSKFDENSECSSFEYTRPITTIFCTRHDSDTVVTCAKYRCDRPRKFYTRVFWIFIEFRIRSKYA